jgi:hypothetical protein
LQLLLISSRNSLVGRKSFEVQTPGRDFIFFSRSGGNSPFGFKTGRAWRYGKPTTAFAMSDLQFPEIGRCDFLRALSAG